MSKITNQLNLVNITANINLKDPSAHQFIYASQLYETFFAVSATLTIEKNCDNIECLKTMHLNLINFKGHLNLGLLEGTKDSWYCNNKTKGSMITLHLKATYGKHGPISGEYLDVDCKMTPLSDLKYLIVNRELEKYSEKSGIEMLCEGIFDKEHYKRDGARCMETGKFQGNPTKEIIDDLKKLGKAFQPTIRMDENELFKHDSESFQKRLSPAVCETTRSKFISV
jgi:hypothetical protein